MENKMKVIIVNDFDYVQGGASKVAIDTAQILFDNNIDVTLFSATHKENNYKFNNISLNQKECLTDGIKGAFRSLYNFKVKKEFGKLLDSCDKNNTIIHIHGWTKSLSSSVMDIAFKKNFKVIITVHDYFLTCPNGGYFDYNKNHICTICPMSLNCLKTNCDSRNYGFKLFRVVRQLIQNKNTKKLKNIKNIISISDFSIDKIKDKLDSKTNIVKISNPISIDKNDRTKVENNEYYIYVGRLSKEKGLDLFCEAVTSLNLKGIVVGDGSEKERLENKYSNISFVGWKNKEEVEQYMKNSKCLIFPSLWYEGAPLTILESLALGIPCIVSNKCAGIEFITDDGLLFEYKNVEDLKQKISLYETSDIKQMSENAYNNYWNNPYNEEKYYNSLIKYYNLVLKKGE